MYTLSGLASFIKDYDFKILNLIIQSTDKNVIVRMKNINTTQDFPSKYKKTLCGLQIVKRV